MKEIANFKKLRLMLRTTLFISLLQLAAIVTFAQPDRWQQRVKYTMDINMDVSVNRFTGKQKLEYTNNSPDTLHRVFYHLYFNAFQPNSMMDMRSRELGKIVLGKDREGNDVHDWDDRVRDRILHLKPDEIGYQKILSLNMNGVPQPFEVKETILEVKLTTPILPKSTVALNMDFEAQVPLQVRRSGRDNPSTGVRYSMSQWYPKLCEYDYEGWHPTPYVAREFYGVWGDYDVKISIDKNYIIGGTGYLQNANQIGYGYETAGTKVTRPAGNKLTWHFIAPEVHDFMWAADPEYRHITKNTASGVTINVFYNADEKFLRQRYDTMRPSVRNLYNNNFKNYSDKWHADWQKVADAAVVVLPFIEKNFGPYPYKQYSFIHGGDGGMEYPMGTLLVGPSLGTVIHEWMHSWYQMLLGTNESLYAWMDEGFTSFAETLVSDYYREQTSETPTSSSQGTGPRRQLTADTVKINPHMDAYRSYFRLAASGYEEPLTTHADHFSTNYAYGSAAYSKGEVFLAQLGYITGDQVRDRILKTYYQTWRYKHPDVADFFHIAEKESNMKLDWYRNYWVNTTKVVDYAIDSLWEDAGKTKIRLRRNGEIPMPIDLQVDFKDGSKQLHYIPMYLMFGEKPVEYPAIPRTTHESWKWTHPTYVVEVNRTLSDLSKIEIDPTQRLADLRHQDNVVQTR
jgi:hypothetical protein